MSKVYIMVTSHAERGSVAAHTDEMLSVSTNVFTGKIYHVNVLLQGNTGFGKETLHPH